MICAEATRSHCKRHVTRVSHIMLMNGLQQMSVFSFDIQNGVAMESMNANGQDSNISPFNDPSWAPNDYRDPTFDYSYTSSNCSFSCGSLTNGSVTPQSSVSASTSRRQSLVSSAVRSMSFFDPSSQGKGFRRPRTPVTLNDQYLSTQALDYACSTPSTSPTSQGLQNMFSMDMEDTSFSGKLQAALGLDSADNTQGSSFSSYEEVDMVPQGLLGQEPQSLCSTYEGDQFTNSLRGGRNFPYHGIASDSTFTSRDNSFTNPQTVMPSQTTFQSNYAVPQTPPRVLGDAFISPSKTTFATPPGEQLHSIFDQPENLDFSGGSPDTGQDMMHSLGLQHSSTKTEYTDDDSTFLSGSTDQSPGSDDQTSTVQRRKYRKRESGSRRKVEKQMNDTVKKVAISKHACPMCKHRPGEAKIQFKRPEHLSRHIASVHGDESEKVPCVVKSCPTSILKRTDNLTSHYRNTHMYGPSPAKGKKREWLSIEAAKALGLGHIDPRNPEGKLKSKAK